MTPDEFTAQCKDIVATQSGDAAHRAMDALAMKTLAAMGYNEGAQIFINAVKPYHAGNAPEVGEVVSEARMVMFLEILDAMGGSYQHDCSDSEWLPAFCEEHEGRDPDTFNMAIQHEFTTVSHDVDTGVSTVRITDNGRRAIARLRTTPPASPDLVEAVKLYDDALDIMFDGPDESDRDMARTKWRLARQAALAQRGDA